MPKFMKNRSSKRYHPYKGRPRRTRRPTRTVKKYPLMRRYRQVKIGAFPNSKTVNLRYVEDFTLNPGVLGASVQVFSMNGLFDPNITGGGHQPMFFDNYTALYDSYRVNHATITFVAMDNHIVNQIQTASGTTSGQFYAANERAVRMFIVRDRTTTDYSSSLNTLIEEGNTNMVWRYCPQTTSPKQQLLRMSGWPRRILQVNSKSESTAGTTTSNPLNEAYFICGVDNYPASNADSMNFQVIITYNATFFDLKKNQTQN